MKKSLFIVFVLVLALAASAVLCACSGGGNDPFAHFTNYAESTEAQKTAEAPDATEAVDATDEPVDATDEPVDATDEPVVTPEPEERPFCEVIPLDAAHSIDLDGDGADETVLITSTPDEYDDEYSITVTPGREGDAGFSERIGLGYECYAMAIDSGMGDGSRAVLICYWCDSDDPFTHMLRAGDDGYELIETFGYFYDPTESVDNCFENGNLCIATRTDILGTQDVHTEVRLTENGYESIDGVYFYPSYNDRSIAVIADMPATIIDESTGEGSGITVFRGDSVVPLRTDMETYAVVRLSSGQEVYIFFDDFDYIPYINGRPQHDYLDVFYCD